MRKRAKHATEQPRGINPAVKPSGDGCVECLTSGGWWLHLRRGAERGHIGCCDSSPSQHASRHAAMTGHPITASFEPGEDWFYDYEKSEMVQGVELAPPRSHPEGASGAWAGAPRPAQLATSAERIRDARGLIRYPPSVSSSPCIRASRNHRPRR